VQGVDLHNFDLFIRKIMDEGFGIGARRFIANDTSSHLNLLLLAIVIYQNFSNPSLLLSKLKHLVLRPSRVVQYPVLFVMPMSTVAISVPSFTILTLLALNPFIVVSSLPVTGINS